MTFPEFLRRALQRVNILGKPFSIGVMLGGLLLIVLQAVFMMQLAWGMLAQFRALIGTGQSPASQEAFAQLEQRLTSQGAGVAELQQMSGLFGQELTRVLEPMSDTERSQYVLTFVFDILRSAGPALLLTLVLIVLVQMLTRAFFLVLALHRAQSFVHAFADTLRALPRLLLVWIGFFLCSCLWLPAVIFVLGFFSTPVLGLLLPSIAVPVILYPRFVFAPIIFLQEGLGIRASLTASYERTRGKWWIVVRNLVGAMVVVWIFTTVMQNILDLLVSSLLPYSLFGIGLYAFSAFIALIAAGYRTFFAVELKEAFVRA